MTEPFIGEIRMFAGTFEPAGWFFCNGQLLQIAQYDTLYSLIGTTYGGDNVTTFALPDLRSRVPIHQSLDLPLGTSRGVESVTLTVDQLPAHNHSPSGSGTAASSNAPQGNVLANLNGGNASDNFYGTDNPQTNLAPECVTMVGNNEAHTNLQPYMCLNFIIASQGIYPSKP